MAVNGRTKNTAVAVHGKTKTTSVAVHGLTKTTSVAVHARTKTTTVAVHGGTVRQPLWPRTRKECQATLLWPYAGELSDYTTVAVLGTTARLDAAEEDEEV